MKPSILRSNLLLTIAILSLGPLITITCSHAEILLQDNFDNWPQVDGGNWYCCANTSCASVADRHDVPSPWTSMQYGGSCGLSPEGINDWAHNTFKIVDNGRSGKGLGACFKKGIGNGYASYLFKSLSSTTPKLYVRYYWHWPIEFNKTSLFWKQEYVHSDANWYFCMEGYGGGAEKKMQDGYFGFALPFDSPAQIASFSPNQISVSAFNSGFGYFEWMVDVPNGTFKMWYGDHNTEANPAWTYTYPAGFANNPTGIIDLAVGMGNHGDYEWDNTDWACLVYDDVVVSTSWVGPIGGTPPVDNIPPAAPSGVSVN